MLPDGDGDGRGLHALPPQVRVHLGHLLLVHLVQLGVELLPSVNDVLLQQVLGDLLHAGQGRGGGEGLLRPLEVVVVLLLGAGVRGHVRGNHELGQVLVLRTLNYNRAEFRLLSAKQTWRCCSYVVCCINEKIMTI